MSVLIELNYSTSHICDGIYEPLRLTFDSTWTSWRLVATDPGGMDIVRIPVTYCPFCGEKLEILIG
jgi:hypothetical protein